MLFKGLDGLLVIVLAAYGQQHATPAEFENPFLKVTEGLATRRCGSKLDAFQSVVADYAAQKRVVQVQNQDLLGRRGDVREDVSILAGHVHQQAGGEGLLALKPGAVVHAGKIAPAVGKELDIADMNEAGSLEPKLGVDEFAKRVLRNQAAVAYRSEEHTSELQSL